MVCSIAAHLQSGGWAAVKLAFVAVSIGVLLALPLVGCHSALIKTSPDVTFPLQVSAEAPAFLFPIILSHLNAEGISSQLEETVSAHVVATVGNAVISGQPVIEMVGSLSYELAEMIDNEVRRGTFMVSDAGKKMAAQVANVMERVVVQLVNRGLLKSPIMFKYIIVVHSHGEPDVGGATLNVNSWGGIYDTETEQVIAYSNATDTYAKEEEALRGQLQLAYDNIIEKLLHGLKK
jgi:hypothetical protein